MALAKTRSVQRKKSVYKLMVITRVSESNPLYAYLSAGIKARFDSDTEHPILISVICKMALSARQGFARQLVWLSVIFVK